MVARCLCVRPKPVVFKRWSRRTYAAFASLHREVVIGVIKASICYASMLKMKILMNDDHCPDSLPARGDVDDDDGPGGVSTLGVAGIMGIAISTVGREDEAQARCALPSRSLNLDSAESFF
ncbi:MAG: hypothetical protein ACI35Q_00750 [Marinilabiliaceae bacterium]